MISAKGLEPTNFINPDLTWKTVSKGYRRSSRRSRKPVDRSPKSDAETDKGTESPSETTVSESEKLGVAVLGHRFSEKVEQVPIKKRRFTVRPPSPPPCFSSSNEHDDQFLNGPYSSDQGSCLKLISKKRLIAMDASGKTKNVKRDFNEDFSGIEILAAAAASNNSADDDLPPRECISSKEETHFSPRDIVVEVAREGSGSPEDADKTHHSVAKGNWNDVDTRTVERSVSSRDVRLHWDLNVEMDAWEQPCDTIIVDSQTVDVQGEKPQVLEACELHEELGDDKNIIGTPVQPIIDIEEHKFESNSDVNKSDDKCAPLEKVLESSTSTDIVVENSPCKESDKVEGSVLPEEIEKTLSVDGSAKKYNEDLSLVPRSSKVHKLEGADTSEMCMASATVCSIDGGVKSLDMISSDGSSPPMPVNKTDVGRGHTEFCNEDVSASGVYLGENQSVVTVNAEGLGTETLVAQIDDSKVVHEFEGSSMPIVGSVGASNSHEVSQRCGGSAASSLDRVTTENTCNESHILDICDKDLSVGKVNTKYFDKDHIVGKENSMDLDAGYDSQYEDGELRESDVPYWEDNDCEDGEAECVDYGTDTCDDTGDYCMSSKFGMQVECSEDEFCVTEVRSLDRNIKTERLMGSASNYLCENFEHGAAGDALRQTVVSKVLTSGSDELPRGSEMSSDITAEIPEGYMARKHSSDCLVGFDEKDASTKVVGSGLSRKELPGIIESASNTLHRSDNILVQRSRSNNFDLSTQPDQTRTDHSVAKEISDLLEVPCKSPGGGCWESRRRDSPTYNGSFGSDRPRPRSVIEGSEYSEAGIAGVDNHVHRQSINSSNSSYRHQPRRSPCSRDNAHNMQRGVGPLRDGSPDRRRFRRYPPGVGRGFREDYHRTLPQNGSDEYPYHVNRMVRREQNTSPHREHDAAKPRSRSPDYRFDSRMERMRLPFQKQGFGAKCEMGFISSPRRRFLPQHNSRWFDDPNGTSDEYPCHVNHMARRDQNASPPPRGPVYYRRPPPFKRSQSRSRSRSPGPWMSREHDAKHRSSRSPDYRFNSRMERMRLPFQKQGFGAKCEMGFMSSPRRRFSPQHNSRWFDDPNGASDHFRGRRLPGRTFQQQQGQRFDSVGTSRRMNSDDYFEPAMRPARFTEMGRGGGRARRYEGSADERRNNDDRFEVFSRARRYDSDGVVRRFRYDEEDSFATRNTHNNNINNDSDNNNGAERRPRNNAYLGSDELVKRKVN